MTRSTFFEIVIFGLDTFFFLETDHMGHDSISTFDLIKSPCLRAIDSLLFFIFICS